MLNTAIMQQLDVRIFESREELGKIAADIVAKTINYLFDNQPFVNMVFAAAPSQNEFLSSLRHRKDINWARVNAFHMDEYLGLEADAPQGFGNFLKERLFSAVGFNTINYINSTTSSEEQECLRYSELLTSCPPDIVCMGIGENAHIAFNDPGVADFQDPVIIKKVQLDGQCRQQQVNDGCFLTLDEVPNFALTLTIPALMQAKHIYCIAPGKLKAQAVYNTVHGEISEDYPSSIIRTHPEAILFLDRQSAALLHEFTIAM
jgi:glucosamine-6-phosphate deaminase